MIDVSELMSDPDFATAYKVIRSKGKWIAGRFKTVEKTTLAFYGPVQPATTKDLQQLPEGDREKSVMKFFCSPPNELYITEIQPLGEDEDEEEAERISDVVEYRGARYKILQVADWSANGYFKAFGTKTGG